MAFIFPGADFLELSPEENSIVEIPSQTGRIDIYCNASGYPTPAVTWFGIYGAEKETRELTSATEVNIKTTYTSGCRVISRLTLFNDSVSIIRCMAEQEGKSSFRETIFRIPRENEIRHIAT